MKKIITVALLVTFIILFSIIGFLVIRVDSTKKEKAIRLNSFPEVTLIDKYNNQIQTKLFTLSKSKKIIVLFSSTCEHCLNQIKYIEDLSSKLEDYDILFISIEPMRNLLENDTIASKSKYLNFYHVSIDDLIKNFGTVTFPTIYIYDETNVLQKKILGETHFEFI